MEHNGRPSGNHVFQYLDRLVDLCFGEDAGAPHWLGRLLLRQESADGRKVASNSLRDFCRGHALVKMHVSNEALLVWRHTGRLHVVGGAAHPGFAEAQ